MLISSFDLIIRANHRGASDMHEIVPAGNDIATTFRSLVDVGYTVTAIELYGLDRANLGEVSILIHRPAFMAPIFRVAHMNGSHEVLRIADCNYLQTAIEKFDGYLAELQERDH